MKFLKKRISEFSPRTFTTTCSILCLIGFVMSLSTNADGPVLFFCSISLCFTFFLFIKNHDLGLLDREFLDDCKAVDKIMTIVPNSGSAKTDDQASIEGIKSIVEDIVNYINNRHEEKKKYMWNLYGSSTVSTATPAIWVVTKYLYY